MLDWWLLQVANMLYLEAPAGVGYSYSDDRNYTTDDNVVRLGLLSEMLWCLSLETWLSLQFHHRIYTFGDFLYACVYSLQSSQN